MCFMFYVSLRINYTLQRALVYRSDEDVLQNRLEFGLLDKKSARPTNPPTRHSEPPTRPMEPRRPEQGRDTAS